MSATAAQAAHFRRRGFFFIANPFGRERMAAIDARQRAVEPEWEQRAFPDGCNRGACQFLMLGELGLELVERPELVALARQLLACDEVHIGACGLGDAGKTVSEGKQQHQVHWHADGHPDVAQVSLRTALDRHGANNGPLRVLPGAICARARKCARKCGRSSWQRGPTTARPSIALPRTRTKWP